MARYIDADKLLEQLNKKQAEVAKYRYTEGFNEAIMRVRSMVSSSATVDVVPKSEFEAMQRMYGEKLQVAEALIATLNKPKTKVVREIFEEIESIIRKYDECPKYQLILDLAKLEKKYSTSTEIVRDLAEYAVNQDIQNYKENN